MFLLSSVFIYIAIDGYVFCELACLHRNGSVVDLLWRFPEITLSVTCFAKNVVKVQNCRYFKSRGLE